MLTERFIRGVKADGTARTYWDSQVTGLGLQITQGGKRNLVLRYKVGGRKRQVILCRAGEVPLREIRKRAGQELLRIRAGETDPLERQNEATNAPTVADGLAKFFDEYVPERIAIGRLTARTVEGYRQQARRYVEPALGSRKVAEVCRHHVERMLGALRDSPVQRNRVLALTSRLFAVFETWDWRPQNSNPAKGIERAREEARDRILSPTEIAALSAALNELEERHPAPVAAIRFAAVTGLRIGEGLAIEWEHVDFESGRLTLPSTKTGRRVHDLPAAALAILTELPRINRWAFTSGREAAVTYRWVRKVFLAAASAAGLEGVRLHDLRRTVMTTAAAAGVSTHVLRDLLGHSTAVMADRYIRAVGDPIREARKQVGAAMASMMEGSGGEVVPLRRGK